MQLMSKDSVVEDKPSRRLCVAKSLRIQVSVHVKAIVVGLGLAVGTQHCPLLGYCDRFLS